MRVNLADAKAVTSNFAPEYDALVDRAATASDRDLSEFKIGDDHKVPGSNAYNGAGFRSRLDGLLGYLRSLMPAETIEKIGFR